MTDKQLIEILKYSHPNQLYVVTWNNLLKLLITPFKVSVLGQLEGFVLGEIVWVDEVKVTKELNITESCCILDNQAFETVPP